MVEFNVVYLNHHMEDWTPQPNPIPQGAALMVDTIGIV